MGMNRKRWVPVAAAGATLAVLVGVSLLSNNGRAAGPPVLRLAAAQGSYATDGSYVAPSSYPAAASDGRGAFRLIGTLPDGPSEARVRDLPRTEVPVARVRALAAALGENAAPVRIDGGWKVGDLAVTDEPGNPWTWGATCGPDTPVASDGVVASDLPAFVCPGGTSSSGTSSSGTGPSDTRYACPDGVKTCPSPGVICMRDGPCSKPTLPYDKVLLTEPQALAATAKIRDALGLAGVPTRVEGLSVIVEPLAGGLPTNGMATLVQLSSQAKPVSASGSLSTGREGDLYPLRSARKAFDDMPIVAMGAPCRAAGCPEGPAITGARLGLGRVALDKGAAALVPTWLFTVQGSPVPLVALAVAAQFVGGPDPVRTNPAVPRGREGLGFDAAYADADPNVLIVRYGDSGSCPSQDVRHDVVEHPDRVVVTLTRKPNTDGRPCTSDYKAELVRVALMAPLGSREVLDGSREASVPISTGTPPFG